jgi:methionyl-tRNA synthetase
VFEPYLPATCASIRKQLNAGFLQIPSEEDISSGWLPTYIKSGHQIGKAEYLFTRIDDKKADEWREHFGGSQAEREKKKKDEAEVAAKKAAAKEKNKAKKAAQKSAAAAGGGVEKSAKGGAKGQELANGVEQVGEDAAVDKVVDGIAQVTLPSS